MNEKFARNIRIIRLLINKIGDSPWHTCQVCTIRFGWNENCLFPVSGHGQSYTQSEKCMYMYVKKCISVNVQFS